MISFSPFLNKPKKQGKRPAFLVCVTIMILGYVSNVGVNKSSNYIFVIAKPCIRLWQSVYMGITDCFASKMLVMTNGSLHLPKGLGGYPTPTKNKYRCRGGVPSPPESEITNANVTGRHRDLPLQIKIFNIIVGDGGQRIRVAGNR